ncbi:hypothetical protein IPA_03660 [Ignicoccus pacificus DSM 13166]|uniref:Uncharacterized protein n=1 Tax=Ignicoccus pacificus DSM 13166 TaxID=940294 RepID=A0A977PKU2_9CREN|nr:hypothetical protein IPA_03660 [Ignicoccus pacificus DSM 13166]
MVRIAMRRGEVTLYLTVIALALLLFVGTWMAMRMSPKPTIPELKYPAVKVSPHNEVSCPRELSTFNITIVNPYKKEIYVRLEVSPKTNVTNMSMDAQPLITVPPRSTKIVKVFINTTMPKGIYYIGYKVYLFSSKDMREDYVNTTLIVGNCSHSIAMEGK